MKIVHISYSRFGGAGRSAYRLHLAMLSLGLSSAFLCLDQDPLPENCYLVPPVKSQNTSWFNKTYRAEKALTRSFQKLLPLLDCEAASLPFSNYRLHEHPLVKAADIVNLHWVGGMLDYQSFFSRNEKPVCWTLHDMQPFSGLFHYENDLLFNTGLALSPDNKTRAIKKAAIEKKSFSLQLVSPSDWLLQKAISSPVFNAVEGTVIPYSLDLTLFKPQHKIAAKQKLGLNNNARLLVFVSKHLTVKRKGYQLLHAAMNALAHKYPAWELALLGQDEALPADLKYRRITPGSIQNDEQLSSWYAAADAVVVPSLEDNLPNVMLEAIACGRPVISFKNGGMSEHILPNLTGWVGDPQELPLLLEACYTTVDAYSAAAIRKYAETHFAPEIQVNHYLQVYNRQINS